MPPPNSSSFVLAVSLGPVQDFIATARRCRDLWFGSWLLSELSKAAARAIAGTEGAGALIFPPPDTDLKPNSEDAVVNKLLVLVSDPQSCAAAGKQAAQQRLDEMSDAVWKRLRGDGNESPIHEDVARAQMRDLLEWNWAAAPVENDDFALARRRAEGLLAARKGCRDFGPVGWQLPGAMKSSLDGARESVLKPVITGQSELKLYEEFGLRKGELLDGVGLLKRLGERGGRNENRVFSTSHVAAQGLLQRWQSAGHADEVGHERVQKYEDELRAPGLGLGRVAIGNVPRDDETFGRRDAHLLFGNRLTAFFPNDETKAKRAKEALKSLLRDFNGGRVLEPSPYYALFVADGDKMGASISKATNLNENQNLSRALSLFAEQVKDCVEDARGSLIYAGGDDVLALVPLHSALECARQLHDRFAEVFQIREFDLGWLAPDFPTLSLGMALVHHLEPLSEALFLARKAEKRAKIVDGKNALAVLVNKRSGSELLIADTWGTPTSTGLDDRLKVFIEWAKAGEVAAGLAYEWRDLTMRVPLEMPPLSDPNNAAIAAHNATVSEIHLSEAKRLAKRKRERGGERDVGERALLDLCNVLTDAQAKARAKPNTPWLAHLADELIAAREFAAAISLSEPAPVVPVPAAVSTP